MPIRDQKILAGTANRVLIQKNLILTLIPAMEIIAMPGMLTRTTMDYAIIVDRRTTRIVASAAKITLPVVRIKKIIPINTEIKT